MKLNKFTASENIKRRQVVTTQDGFLHTNLNGSPVSNILVTTRDIAEGEVVSVGDGLCAATGPLFARVFGTIEDDDTLDVTFTFSKVGDWNG